MGVGGEELPPGAACRHLKREHGAMEQGNMVLHTRYRVAILWAVQPQASVLSGDERLAIADVG